MPFQGALADLYRESLALGLVVELTRHLADRAPGPAALPRRSARLAAEAKARIDAAPEAVPSALTLAHDLGTNETTLRRAFKTAHGVRLFDYVLDRRLQMGRDLVRYTALPIGEIAWRCGYGDPANFTHAYRRRFGCATCFAGGQALDFAQYSPLFSTGGSSAVGHPKRLICLK
ncbi:AraC family transcriptional regulator [Rhodobacter capsulatus]|uniref:helix-turn-helix transcriptional regulator n=1 Tax=Rhodobacter capsulatus TaxID=1061 RepID=UPI0015872C78|nr:AraC family transcriptional regulator [Rhodobacter capsulatus]WER10503.1 AraC family transcriptional regulator [Rhodobacter capsulatus]